MEVIIKSPNCFDFISSTLPITEKLSQGCNSVNSGQKEGCQERTFLGTIKYQQTSRKKYHISVEQLKILLDFRGKLASVPVVHKGMADFGKVLKYAVETSVLSL